jgi:aryl-alcohol dehydrogenase-like predicted oxidoreductase
MYAAAVDRYRSLPYARCGRSGLQLPRISLGLWQNFGGSAPFERARDMVLKSFDHGITHFDLANNYGPPPGSAEKNFGRILATDLAAHRDELIVSTKAGYYMWPGPISEANLANVRALNDIAQRRGQSLAQMAIAWVLRKPVITSALVGASSWTQIEESLGALRNIAFQQEELDRIDAHASDGGLNIWAASSQSG